MNQKVYDPYEMQSKVLDNLRFPLVIMVVFIHSCTINDYCMPNWSNMSGADVNVALQILFSHVLSSIAVPTFFVISGYFFFYNTRKFDIDTYRQKIKKRIKSLLVPYLIWNTFSILWIIFLKIGAYFVKGKPLSNILDFLNENNWLRLYWDCYIWGETRHNWLGQITPASGPYLIPLWFLRDLMIVVIITPILYYLIKRFKYFTMILLCICYITGIWPNVHGLSSEAILFFSIGAYFSIHKRNMIEELKKIKQPALLLFIPLLIVEWYYDGSSTTIGQYIYPIFIIVGVISVINCVSALTKAEILYVPSTISKMTFFIYVSHGLIGLPLAATVLERIIPNYDSYWISIITYYILLPVFGISICFVLHEVLKRYFPDMLAVLAGKRIN